MRFTTAAGPDRGTWDRWLPACLLPYAVWTIYVHAIVAAHADFATLLRGLPLVLLVAVAATLGWYRLRDPEAAPMGGAPPAAGAPGGRGLLPFAVMAAAAAWVGSLSAGMPYPVFWAGAVAATGWAWLWHLRGGAQPPQRAGTAGVPAWAARWAVPCVAAAAVCVVLFASRPAADDGFYLSIPATLLRFPGHPVLLHDTMYRLPDAPILLPFYRLSNYGVLAAVLARLTGVDHLVVAYLVLPAVFAVVGVLAWAWLLRRVVPGRWPAALVVLFACVMLLGESNRAYGNFAFMRLFHGKAVLATCLVPAIAAAALGYMRHGGWRNWLLLLATLVASLGLAASAVFVAPAATALALAGGWAPDRASCRRFATGMLATGYVFAMAWLLGSGERGAHALGIASALPMPGVMQILRQTWGPWSTQVLLVAMLAAWAFVRDPARARYFSAGAFFFLLVALNPYTTPFIAAISVGAKTYWRMTWALPLPFFAAVMADGLLARLASARPRALAGLAGLAFAAAAVAFGLRAGTFRCGNDVAVGAPRLKVPDEEYAVARRLSVMLPEDGVVLAPEKVARWVPIFVEHPQLVGVRQMYLSSAFAPAETARRSNLMRYVEGTNRVPGATRWFTDALRAYGVSGVVFTRAALWGSEIQATLAAQGWQTLSCGRYVVMVQDGRAAEGRHAGPAACIVREAAIRR